MAKKTITAVASVLIAGVLCVGAFAWISRRGGTDATPDSLKDASPSNSVKNVSNSSAPENKAITAAMASLSGGKFRMGSDQSARAAERPAHDVVLDSFQIDEHAVTNRQFAEFVAATKYVTTAEQRGWSMTFDPERREWKKTRGADWRRPAGPDTSIDAKENYPVVHVSWYDAKAYADWAKLRLPTEAEWEFAARGGLRDADYPWGNEETPGGKYMANYSQLDQQPGADGFATLAPGESFPANQFGLFDMTGNVWQWCDDFFAEDYYAASPRENPHGPKHGESRVIRGGSWTCPEKFFVGYTVYARASRDPNYSAQNLGFRCAK